MLTIIKKNFNNPDEIMTPEKLTVKIVTINNIKMQKITAEPGWQWSKHLKPIVKTENCKRHHLIYMISGKLASQVNGGKVEEFSPGDVVVIPPGHDGWTVGKEPAVWLEIPH
jgi:quercetin dioxygenase-like cupin family protein